MPAIITHHLFGEDAANRLPEGIIDGQEELLAFLLGNQGPDPLWAHFLAPRTVNDACSQLASAMHKERIVETLMALRTAVSHLPEADERVGRAFALGMLAHYVLDSTTHPFVFAQERALLDADPDLKPVHDDVHAVIESDLDTWMLWSQRGLTVADAPTTANLAHTERILHVAGALVSQVAWQVFGIEVGAEAYGGSVRDYSLIYAVVDPAPSLGTEVLKLLDGIVPHASYARALAHYVNTNDECPAANLACHPWTNPATGEVRGVSFPDLFFEALDRWPAMAEAFTYGNEVELRSLSRELDYEGRPHIA
jgi:hypothetical protein